MQRPRLITPAKIARTVGVSTMSNASTSMDTLPQGDLLPVLHLSTAFSVRLLDQRTNPKSTMHHCAGS